MGNWYAENVPVYTARINELGMTVTPEAAVEHLDEATEELAAKLGVSTERARNYMDVEFVEQLAATKVQEFALEEPGVPYELQDRTIEVPVPLLADSLKHLTLCLGVGLDPLDNAWGQRPQKHLADLLEIQGKIMIATVWLGDAKNNTTTISVGWAARTARTLLEMAKTWGVSDEPPSTRINPEHFHNVLISFARAADGLHALAVLHSTTTTDDEA